MKRLVWGCIICGLCGISLMGLMEDGYSIEGAGSACVTNMVGIAGGAVLIYYGQAFVSRRKRIAEAACSMLQEDAQINVGELATRSGATIMETYQAISYMQQKRMLPHKAKIT